MIFRLSFSNCPIIFTAQKKTKIMKSNLLKFFAVIISISFFLTSCSKAPDKVLVKKDGKWTAIYSYHITGPSYDATDASSSTITFIKDGTGSYIDDSSNTSTFTWSYSKDKSQITIVPAGADPVIYDVTAMEKDAETWTNTSTQIILSNTYTTTVTATLSKVK